MNLIVPTAESPRIPMQPGATRVDHRVSPAEAPAGHLRIISSDGSIHKKNAGRRCACPRRENAGKVWVVKGYPSLARVYALRAAPFHRAWGCFLPCGERSRDLIPG